MRGIVAFSAEQFKNVDGDAMDGLVTVTRAYADQEPESFTTASFGTLTDWLLRDFGNAFYVVWDLEKFAKAIFTLIPDEQKARIDKGEERVYVEDVKIFYVEKWLGLTKKVRTHRVGNFFDETRMEVNFFGLNNFLAEDRKEPDPIELTHLGYQVLDALECMHITPTKLTSPAGLFSEFLKGSMPIIDEGSPPAMIEAANYCLEMMNVEWVKTYQSSVFAPAHKFDRRAAYPSEMVKLPNTDKCKVTYSKEPIPAHWAILNVINFVCKEKVNPFGDEPRTKYTSEELKWNREHGGTFVVLDGFYFTWFGDDHPYAPPINALWEARQYGGILGETCKRTMNGLSGKLDQENANGKPGELCNWVLAAMMRSRNRLAIADFIERYGIKDDVVSVWVDNVSTWKTLHLPEAVNMGDWRAQ